MSVTWNTEIHACPRCGQPTRGAFSEGGWRWAICEVCMDTERRHARLIPEPGIQGSCALCGAEVEIGEPFPRLSEGVYICQSCDLARCVMCGNPEAMIEAGELEPVCAQCRESRATVEARWEAEFWSRPEWKEIFKGERMNAKAWFYSQSFHNHSHVDFTTLTPASEIFPRPQGDWFFLPVFPDVQTRRPTHYELFYRGTVMAQVEPNQRVLDIVLERAKGVRL